MTGLIKNMTSMERTPQDNRESAERFMGQLETSRDYPPGLCLCLTHEELEKLDLDDDIEVGDLLHFFAMGEVTSVSKNKMGDDGMAVRVEMVLTHMQVEDETDEEDDFANN